jgi:HAD superfamily phosphatase (TIGR01681 family)
MSFPELWWLPSIPTWGEGLQAVGDQRHERVWPSLVGLANAKIDSLATLRLDRRLTRLFGETAPPELATKPIRLAVLASSTIDHLLPAIRVGALRRNLWVKTYTCAYGQYSQELMTPGSRLHEYRPDTVLFALDGHHLVTRFEDVDRAAELDKRLDATCADLVRLWSSAREAFGCRVIQQSILPAFPASFGNNEHRLPRSRARAVELLNERLRGLADKEGIDLLALDAAATRNGVEAWHDPALWYRAKQDVHPGAAPFYGDLLGRLLAAQQGLARKCLVLDLDNTVWGGVIGDDGLHGIVVGQGSALGEAYLGFQAYARGLARRGVILAVCSKNDEANALEPFEKHPEMLLKRSDIACFIANWTDKATNLKTIAKQLNIGLDSLVFADDNPFERNIVRRELPTVAVPELPEDPAFYESCLADAGYFEGLHLTEEDLDRSRQYQANLKRETLKSSVTDMSSYLQSLNMELRWRHFDSIGLQRIVQLINKTNQFNRFVLLIS